MKIGERIFFLMFQYQNGEKLMLSWRGVLFLFYDVVYPVNVCFSLSFDYWEAYQLHFGSHIVTMQDSVVCISVADITIDLTIVILLFPFTLKHKVWFIIFYCVISYASWSFILSELFYSFILVFLENPSLTSFMGQPIIISWSLFSMR